METATGMAATGNSAADIAAATYISTSACIGMTRIAATDHPTAGVASTLIATITVTKTCADETGAVKPAADKERSISVFEEGAIVGIIVIIPIVPVPGGEVIIEISGEFVFIDDAIAAGIAIRVGIHILSGVRVLVSIGVLVRRILISRVRRSVSGSRGCISRRRSAIDHRGRCYIDAGAAKADPGAYIYLGVSLGSDQRARDGQGGQS
jgi:hypothetical protein